MEIKGSFEYRKAITVTPERIVEIVECLKDVFPFSVDRIQYTGIIKNGSTIRFNSVKELAKYENFADGALVSINIYNAGYFNLIIKKTYNAICNYGKTVHFSYEVNSNDDEILLKNNLLKELDKAKLNYWWIAKFNPILLLMVISLLSVPRAIYLYGFGGWFSSLFTAQSLIPESAVINALVLIGVFCWAIFLPIWLRVFPVLLFNWGEEGKKIQKIISRRESILYDVFIGIIGNIVWLVLIAIVTKFLIWQIVK